MHKDYGCPLRYESIHLGVRVRCPLLRARHCTVAEERIVEKDSLSGGQRLEF